MGAVQWFMPLALTVCHGAAQDVNPNERSPAKCNELHRIVVSRAAGGQLEEAESLLLAIPAGLFTSSRHSCSGLILADIAALMLISGRLAEAERFAERSISILERSDASYDPVLLRPLHILTTARLGQGKTGRAREGLNRMRSIRVERPEDRAMVHTTSAVQFRVEGKLGEAEPEYLAALGAMEEAERGNSADSGALLTGLGSLYIQEGRLDAARRALDRGLEIFARAKDSVPMDRIKLLNLRAVLHVREGEWLDAERDLSDAVSMAELESQEDSAAFASLLTNYAHVLRRNHHAREARTVESRASALGGKQTRDLVVDVTDFLGKPNSTKR
jgi:tetratricopeptide (TPR) repeat protein